MFRFGILVGIERRMEPDNYQPLLRLPLGLDRQLQTHLGSFKMSGLPNKLKHPRISTDWFTGKMVRRMRSVVTLRRDLSQTDFNGLDLLIRFIEFQLIEITCKVDASNVGVCFKTIERGDRPADERQHLARRHKFPTGAVTRHACTSQRYHLVPTLSIAF